MSMSEGQALKLANEVRIRQATLKRDLRRGVLPFADALEHPDLQRMRLWDVLCCLPMGGGRSRSQRPRHNSPLADDLFTALDVKPLARLEDLTDRQRDRLAGLYRARIIR